MKAARTVPDAYMDLAGQGEPALSSVVSSSSSLAPQGMQMSMQQAMPMQMSMQQLNHMQPMPMQQQLHLQQIMQMPIQQQLQMMHQQQQQQMPCQVFQIPGMPPGYR